MSVDVNDIAYGFVLLMLLSTVDKKQPVHRFTRRSLISRHI